MITQATLIRNAVLTRVRSMVGWGSTAQSPIGTQQPDKLPFCGVYLLREDMRPDGEGNVAEPRFIHSAVIGLSIVAKGGAADALDDGIDDWIDDILTLLLQDTTFVGFGNGRLFEEISDVKRSRVFPGEGETYFAEGRLEITFEFRTFWPPLVVDDLNKIRMTVRPAHFEPDTPSLRVDINLDT